MAGANKPFIFRFFFDAKDAKKGADEVAQSLEGIGDALDGASAEVGADLSRIEQRFRQSATTIGRSTTGIRDDMSKKGSSAGKVFGKGFLSNFGETIGSGDLSPQNLLAGILGDLVQDADDIGGQAGTRFGTGFKGKAMSFITGPMGVLAGAAGIGIGMALIDNIIQGVKQREAEFKAKVQDIFDLLATVDDSIARAERYAGNLGALTPGDMAEDLGESSRIRKLLGLTPAEMYDLLAGSGELPPEVMRKLNRRVGNPGEQAQQEAAANKLLEITRDRARAEERALEAKREQAALDAAGGRYGVPGSAYPSWYGSGQVPAGARRPQNG